MPTYDAIREIWYYSLAERLERLPECAYSVEFVDDLGRQCAAVLEPIKRKRKVLGYGGLVIVDDGHCSTMAYVGREAGQKSSEAMVARAKAKAPTVMPGVIARLDDDWNGRDKPAAPVRAVDNRRVKKRPERHS